MTTVLACLGLVALGCVVGAGVQGWIDRKLLSIARTALWRAQRTSIATQHWADTATQAKAATERFKSIGDMHQRRAQEAWRQAAAHEARAENLLDNARAIHQEMAP